MPNDLPLTALSTGIEITLRELLGESPLPAVTIACDFVLP
jgi:predicted membrane chloride channel (bestrophin family)